MAEFAFLFYVNDWAGGTQWMTRLQRGGYLDILLYQVNNKCFSLQEVKNILGVDFDNVWSAINHKFSEENGKFFNKKMREVMEKRSEFTLSRRENRLGKTKKHKNNTRKTSDKHLEKEKEKEDVNGTEDMGVQGEALIYPTFDDFWNDYDKKRGDKDKVKKKWERLSQSDKEAIMGYIPDYKQSQPDKQYRKDPETFLNNKSWNDEIIKPTIGQGQKFGNPIEVSRLEREANAIIEARKSGTDGTRA